MVLCKLLDLSLLKYYNYSKILNDEESILMIPDGAIISGFISMLINDLTHISIDKIKQADNVRKYKSQNFETRVYQVIIDAINEFTSNKYNNQDILYETAEHLLNDLKTFQKNIIKSGKLSLKIIIPNIDETNCEKFLRILCHEISKEINFDVYKEILLELLSQEAKYNSIELQHIRKKLDEIILKLNNQMVYTERDFVSENNGFQNNKKQKYIENWNNRLFLHLDKDKKPLTLADAFITPNYKKHKEIKRIGFLSDDTLKQIIIKYIEYDKSSTMLITGVPGIGKSSIISWIANEYHENDNVIILRFRDWEKEELENGLLKAICNTLKCKKRDLENNILIIDGYDEIKLVNSSNTLLEIFNNDILDFQNLKIIFTSRPDYLNLQNFFNVFELLPFELKQIKAFYKIIKDTELAKRSIDNLDLKILGIPVILYMSIMSNFDFSEKSSKPELYDRIFSEKGGIFDKLDRKSVV